MNGQCAGIKKIWRLIHFNFCNYSLNHNKTVVKFLFNILNYSLTVAAFSLFSCGSSDSKSTATKPAASPGGQGANQPPMAVDIFVIKPTLINEKIEVSGSLMANESTEIHPEASGRLVATEYCGRKVCDTRNLARKNL